MLLARLVTGRYGYETAEDQTRPKPLPASEGWVSRLVAILLIRKRAGSAVSGCALHPASVPGSGASPLTSIKLLAVPDAN